MRPQESQQNLFSDPSEQLPSQFYLLDSATGEYRQYSAVAGYPASNHGGAGAGAGAGSGQPRMQAATEPLPVPSSLFPVPIAVGPAGDMGAGAGAGGAAESPSGGGGTSTSINPTHHQHHPQASHRHRYLDLNLPLPTDPPAGAPPAMLAAHPHPQQQQQQLDNHHLEPRHLPLLPLPQLHPRLQQRPHPLHLQSHLVHRFPGRAVTMASLDEHGMAAQQEAAKAYQPALDGPIVGDKTPIASIVEEYAKADPIYVEKTMACTTPGDTTLLAHPHLTYRLLTPSIQALPQTYHQYRPIKGDGNCGWRAIGFSYFEMLVERGDADQVEGEVARLMSMNHYLGTVGGYDYYEDWADEAIGLLRELASCVTDAPTAHALIYERWTDVGTGSALIYYLRLLAATHLKAHPEQYDPFVPDGQGIQSYCGQSVELPDREIEQLGIIALYNCLLKPLDFVLEIAYLDRSPGAEVNTYRFPEEANGKDVATLGPIIHLLYRPDHYDILYSPHATSSLAPAPGQNPISMQVNRATHLYSQTPINSTHNNLGAYSTTDFGLLASLPSASTSNMPMLSSPDTMQASSCSPFTPDCQWMPPLPVHDTIAPRVHGRPRIAVETTTSHGSKQPLQAALSPSSPRDSECNIRFTKMQYDYQEDSSRALLGLLPFNVTTTTFKNSVWNRAHFGNPEFRPEQWHPGDDGTDDRNSTRKKKGVRET